MPPVAVKRGTRSRQVGGTRSQDTRQQGGEHAGTEGCVATASQVGIETSNQDAETSRRRRSRQADRREGRETSMFTHSLRRSEPVSHRSRPTDRRYRRRILLWLCIPLLFVVAGSAMLYAHTQGSAAAARTPAYGTHAPSAPMQPADWFIQSIVTGDGALGWHQLCPNIQAQLPEDVLVQQANTMHAAAARQGVWPTIEPMGTRTQSGGGVVHIYRVTAHWPNGATQQQTFSVLTGNSGCVADVQMQLK